MKKCRFCQAVLHFSRRLVLENQVPLKLLLGGLRSPADYIPGMENLNKIETLGPVVQSIVSLTILLIVKMLTVLESIMSNSQVFLLKKCE